jgi:hypothetical protein
MNVRMRYADHAQRRVEEPLDAEALLLAVFDALGTVLNRVASAPTPPAATKPGGRRRVGAKDRTGA